MALTPIGLFAAVVVGLPLLYCAALAASQLWGRFRRGRGVSRNTSRTAIEGAVSPEGPEDV